MARCYLPQRETSAGPSAGVSNPTSPVGTCEPSHASFAGSFRKRRRLVASNGLLGRARRNKR